MKARRDGIFVYSPRGQTLAARKPWFDSRDVLFLMVNSDIDDEHPEWRMHWFAGIAMLRVVGHVLAKVDSDRSAKHRSAINTAWSAWRSDRTTHSIFWDFIEEERNNLLKAYHYGAKIEQGADKRPELVHSSGENGISLFAQAAYWWRSELEKIEDSIST